MGDAAEAILDGDCCQFCGEFFLDDYSPGFPRTCAGCGGDDIPGAPSSAKAAKNKRRRERKRIKRHAALEAADTTGWEKKSNYHFQRLHNGKRLDWYPSTGKWCLDNVLQPGTPQQYLAKE